MNVTMLLLPALVAAAVSYLLTPLAGTIALRLGAVDQPAPRKVHTAPMPRLGGIAVIGGMLLGTAAMWWLLPPGAWTLPRTVYLGIGLGVLPIIAVSFRDDIKPLPARVKFLVHLAGAAIAVSFGVALNTDIHLFGQTLAIGWLAFPLSVLWIVGATNAFNIVDGLDGLSSGLALISAVSLAGVFVIGDEIGAAGAVLVIAGALCGFLPYNIYPARMFLGDTGATAVGFCLAALALRGGATLSAGFATLLPVFVLGMPIAETVISMARRVLRRLDDKDAGGMFTPDKNHMHHRLLALGISHARAVFILYAAGLFLACGALGSMLMTTTDSGLLVFAMLLAGFFGVRRLGYAEFAVIRNGLALRVYEAPVIKSSMFVVFLDLSFVALAAYAAVGLRTDDWQLTANRAATFGMIAVLAPITVTVFSRMGLYRENWRLAGVEDFARACGAVVISAALGLTIRLVLSATPTPSLPLYSIYAMLSLMLVIGSRASHQFLAASRRPLPGQGRAALIYGAGRQGVGAFRELLLNVSANLRPVAFIDDDPSKAGKVVNGVPIAGSVRDLEAAIRKFEAGAVIVTSDNISDTRLATVGAVCDRAGVALLKMQITFDQCVGGVLPAPLVAVPEAGAARWTAAAGKAGERRAEAGARLSGGTGWKMSEPARGESNAEGGRPSLIVSHPCPACRSLAVHRSHARRFRERLHKKFTAKRPYRCGECGWRGWRSVPDIASYQSLIPPTQTSTLDSIDNGVAQQRAAGGR